MEEQEGYYCLCIGCTDEIKDTDSEYRDERICYGLRSRDHRTCVNGAARVPAARRQRRPLVILI